MCTVVQAFVVSVCLKLHAICGPSCIHLSTHIWAWPSAHPPCLRGCLGPLSYNFLFNSSRAFLLSTEGAIEKANALQAAQEELRAGEIVPDITPIQNVSVFGSMAMFASKVAAGSRQSRDKCEEKTEIVLMGERSAAAAMGAKHTEEQLLRANRSVSILNHVRPSLSFHPFRQRSAPGLFRLINMPA